jgi:hypothetical protein
VASDRGRAGAWARRAGLFVALCAAAAGDGAVSAEPPAVRARGRSHAAASPALEAAPSRALGIAAQDNWLGD